jgi:hypothetical protein
LPGARLGWVFARQVNGMKPHFLSACAGKRAVSMEAQRYLCHVHVPFKPRMLSSRSWQSFAGFTLAIGLLSTNGTAQSSSTRTPVAGSKRTNSPDRLKKFRQDHIRQIDNNIDETTMFSYAFVVLNGDSRDEAIVYLTGRSWCGTGMQYIRPHTRR